MRLGSTIHICSVCIAVGVGAGVLCAVADSMGAGLPNGIAAVAVGAGAGIIAGALLTPLFLSFGRGVQRLGRQVQVSAEEGKPGNWSASGLLNPLSTALSDAVHAWSDRCDRLTTQLREAEIKFRVAEAERAQYEAVLHSLRDAVIVTDAFSDIAMANDPAAKLLGFDPQSAMHKPIKEVVQEEALIRQINEAIQAGVIAKQKHFEMSIQPEKGDHVRPADFDVTMACLPDPKSGVGGVVTILRDITREKEISQMKSDFVSQASHELRTPLSSINAYIEMLMDSEAPDEASRQEFYQIIKAEADRVSRMIDNMLNISRIEAGIVKAEYSEVDFVKVIREVIEMMTPQAKSKNMMLIEKSGPLVYTAQADRDMVYQVVMNLVSNAIKYTPEGGRVTVTVDNDDSTRSVLVSVSDTGLGIPPESIGRVFEKFYRIENYKRVAKGTGLGLNLVKQIVEVVHHGRVGVTSEVGMGSRFWFSVPYEPDNA